MTFPSFLIIGSMKAGTTSLFRDLRNNPAVFMPSDKELNNLNTDAVLAPHGTREYQSLFKSATPSQVCGEASTAYTKLPDIQGVAKRAQELLGSDVRLIYLVRNPIGRLISQYHHSVIVSGLTLQIDDAILNHAPLVNYSKYAMQISPWIEQFGRDQVRILVFEDYVENRATTIQSICDFLEVPSNAAQVQEDVVFNKGSGRPLNEGPFSKVAKSGLYRKLVRPLFPLKFRDTLRKNLLPKAPTRVKPKPESIELALEQLHEDMDGFRGILGVTDLPWDLSESVDRFADA